MWQSSRRLQCPFSQEKLRLRARQGDFKLSCGKVYETTSCSLSRAQPSLPVMAASKAQLHRRRHLAGKVPVINTHLVKYRENLKAWGSGQMPVNVWVWRGGCCCLWCPCDLGQCPRTSNVTWCHQCVEKRQRFQTVRQWNMRVKGEMQETKWSWQVWGGSCTKEHAFPYTVWQPTALPTQCLGSSWCSGYK